MDVDGCPPTTGGAVVARVAGLPVAALGDLRCDESWQVVQHIMDAQDDARARGRDLATALEGPIGETSPGRSRSDLVALRRALYNARRPPPAAMAAASAALTGELQVRVRTWIEALDGCERSLARLPTVLEEEQQARHRHLRRWAGTEVFRRGLAQASPALSSALRQWSASDRPGPPSRKLELRLSRYLARVVTKTSPYATFTMMTVGHWEPDPVPIRWKGPWNWRGAVEPNVWLLLRVLSDLADEDGALADRFEVRVNPSLAEDQGRLWFLNQTEDQYRSVAASEPIMALLRTLDGDEPHSMGDLRRRLDAVATTGSGAERFLARLVDLGLLEPHPPVADQSPRHLDELIANLGSHPATGPLSRIVRALDRHADTPDTLGLQRETRTALEALRPARPADAPRGGRAPMPRLPDKNLFYENAVFASPSAHLGLAAWRPAIEDLNTVRAILGGFQRDTVVRLLAAQVFSAEFGAGAQVAFGRFHRALAGAMAAADGHGPAAELHAVLYQGRASRGASSGVAGIRELQRYRDRVSAMLGGHTASPDGTVHLPPDAITDALAARPDHVDPVGSLACYVQLLDTDEAGAARLVLNGVAAGHDAVPSRVHRLLTAAGLPTPTARTTAEGAEPPAEITGLFGHNGNLRAATTPHEIGYPGVVSRRPAEHRTPLGELAVRHDPGTGLLLLVRAADGVRVRPRHTGMIATPYLPRTARLLFQLFGDQPSIVVPPWAVFSEPPRRTPADVLRTPRVVIGHVTVARRTWYAPRGSVPRRGKGTSPADHLLVLARWFRAHGIPARCFVFSLDPGTWGADPARTARLAKPSYLDLADPALVALLDRQLADSGACVVFQEALPDPMLAPPFTGGAHHVVEYVVQASAEEDAHGR